MTATINLYRPTLAVVDERALRNNVCEIRRLLRPGTKLMVSVKADGYGHGAATVARVAVAAGAAWLAVATLEEAIALREAGIEAAILVFGSLSARAVREAAANRISVTLTGNESWLTEMGDVPQRLGIHVNVDTGMNRLGLRSEAAFSTVLQAIQANPQLVLEGVYTHFACGDMPENALTHAQIARFRAYVAAARAVAQGDVLAHAANSGGILLYPDAHFDMVRLGIAAYGYGPLAAAWGRLTRLQPALHVYSAIARIANVKPGETIGYGATFTATQHMRVATVPIGYADGYFRCLSNRGEMVLHGVRVPVVGRVCMDQLMLDVTQVPAAKVGDMVTVFGCHAPAAWSWQAMEAQADASAWLRATFAEGADYEHLLSLDELAAWADTIPYEWMCALGKRVPRIGVPVL